MPKIRIRKSAAKRFKVTGRGKIMHKKTHKSHLLEWKRSSRKRKLSKRCELIPPERGRVKKILGV